MAELQSKFQNLKAKINQGEPDVDDRQKDGLTDVHHQSISQNSFAIRSKIIQNS